MGSTPHPSRRTCLGLGWPHEEVSSGNAAKRPYIVVRVEQMTPSEANCLCLSGGGQVLHIPGGRNYLSTQEDVTFDAWGCSITAGFIVDDPALLPDVEDQ